MGVAGFLRDGRLSFALRLLIGAVILLGAVPKLADIEKNSVYLVYSYNVFSIHPVNIARFLGTTAPYLEAAISVGLVTGLLTRLAAAGWALMSLAYFATKIDLIFVQHRIVPCGCFPGILPEMLVTQSIWIDVAMLLFCTQIIFADRNRLFLSVVMWLPEMWRNKLRLLL